MGHPTFEIVEALLTSYRHIGAGTIRMRLAGIAFAGRLIWQRRKRHGTRRTREWYGGAKSRWQNCGKNLYESARERDGATSSL
jgi:hypothetical protein